MGGFFDKNFIKKNIHIVFYLEGWKLEPEQQQETYKKKQDFPLKLKVKKIKNIS